jgi:predicted transcriptional regulator
VRKVTAVRREFVVKAVKMGHRPSAVAAFLHCTPSAISKIIARSL